MPKRLFALSMLVATTGCAYRTPAVHVPESVPAIAPGSLALASITVDDSERRLDGAAIADVRRDTEAIVRKAAEARASEARTSSAVVRAHVTLEQHENMAERALARDGIAIFGLWPVLFGMIHQRQKVSVEVEVESDGRTFRGTGTAERAGSLYSQARRRAIAAALDLAFADATAR